ncbi:MAG: hypothetical protein JWP44_3052 [Mucilaginibacter sp.]|nr:hypothetical protein [Mucilaginibacter sp.]
MRNQPLIQERDKQIFEEYAKLWATGKREELIFEELSARYFLERNTVYRIVLKYSKTEKADKTIK